MSKYKIPHKEGWYWMRFGKPPEYGPNIIFIELNYKNELTVNDSNGYDSNWNINSYVSNYPNTQWAGPIDLPEGE